MLTRAVEVMNARPALRVSRDIVLVMTNRKPSRDSTTEGEKGALELAGVGENVVRRQIDMNRAFARKSAHPFDESGNGGLSVCAFLLLKSAEINHHIVLSDQSPGGVVGE